MRLLSLPVLLLAFIAGPAQTQSLAIPLPGQEAGADAALENEVHDFLEDFIDGENTPSQQLGFFADQVHYYDQGLATKAEIARDIRYTMRRWPWRNNRLVEIEYMNPLPAENKVFVSYVVDYEVANADRSIHGRARYGALIGGIGERLRIEGIVENVASRKRAAAAD